MKAEEFKKIVNNWNCNFSTTQIEDVFNCLKRLEELEAKPQPKKYVLSRQLEYYKIPKGNIVYEDLSKKHWLTKYDGCVIDLGAKEVIDPTLITEVKPREVTILFLGKDPLDVVITINEVKRIWIHDGKNIGNNKPIKFVEQL